MEATSIGIEVLAIGTGAGVVFLLWVLGHFIEESGSMKMRRGVRVTPAKSRIRSTAKNVALAFICVAVLSSSIVAIAQTSAQPGPEAQTLQQQVVSLKRQLEVIQGELYKLKALESISQRVITPVT